MCVHILEATFHTIAVNHFPRIWALILVCAVMASFVWGHFQSRQGLNSPERFTFLPSGWAALRRRDLTSLGLFVLFLAIFVAVLFWKEAFAYYDHEMVTLFALRGIDFGTPVWVDS